VVLDAAKALEAANAAGDAQLIRSAMSALEAALRGQAQAKAAQAALPTPEEYESNKALAPVDTEQEAINKAAKIEPSEAPSDQAAQVTPESAEASTPVESVEPAAPLEPPAPLKAAPRPVVAVRGDDRPGMKKTEPAPMMRGGKFGDRKDGGRDAARDASRGPRDASFAGRPDDRAPRRDARDGRDTRPFAAGPWQEAPRLGDTAFRAQRDALEHAQLTLRKLAAQAHGEALTQLLAAWEQRSADQMPSLQELGSRVTAAGRSTWSKAVAQAPAGDASTVLLRLEMAAEVPTPAEHLSARRLLQLQLLTKRNDPAPAQTWGQDTAAVLASQFEAGVARRLQNVLKVLLKP
jgi:ATP-dependent RNA helicase SUPV3L1/SUV3